MILTLTVTQDTLGTDINGNEYLTVDLEPQASRGAMSGKLFITTLPGEAILRYGDSIEINIPEDGETVPEEPVDPPEPV